MMNVEDYFCSTTKEILYQANYFKQVEERNGKLFIQQRRIGEDVTPDSTPLERLNAASEMLALHSLRDNKLLVRTIKKIGKALDTDQWDFSEGFMWQILPSYHGTEEMDKQIFVDDLTALYMLFQCYRVLIWEEQSIPEAYLKIIRQDFPRSNGQSSNDQPSLEDICRHYAESMTANRITDIASQIWLDDGEIFREVLVAGNVFEALFYQMLLHFVAGKEGLNGYRLEECQSCHGIYKKKHGNQRFCPQCSCNKERVRAYRERRNKKKEAVAHEQA